MNPSDVFFGRHSSPVPPELTNAFTPTQIARYYGIPAALQGKGQSIAILGSPLDNQGSISAIDGSHLSFSNLDNFQGVTLGNNTVAIAPFLSSHTVDFKLLTGSEISGTTRVTSSIKNILMGTKYLIAYASEIYFASKVLRETYFCNLLTQ